MKFDDTDLLILKLQKNLVLKDEIWAVIFLKDKIWAVIFEIS